LLKNLELLMTVVLVTHRTALPAIDGMIAGMIAAEREASTVTLVTGGAGLDRYDCRLHVLAEGDLAPNGAFCAEWATGQQIELPIQPAAVPRHVAPTVVVAINPTIAAHITAAERIVYHTTLAGRRLERFEVREENGAYLVRNMDSDEQHSRWMRDRYGRPVRLDNGAEVAIGHSRAIRLLIVGSEELLRDTYPANLVAIGDAADRLGLDAEFSFWDSHDEAFGPFQTKLAGVDGVVLPGGSDMEQVPGQISVAQAAIRQDLPTVGLCLGMQTMATAVVREIGGYNDANMEEADPDAQVKTFIRLRDEQGRPEFRVGVRKSRPVPGTVLSQIFAGAPELQVHCNHRYVLDPDLHPALTKAGLTISSFQEGRDLTDAIELPSLRFYVGMQGHPELMARRGIPHPLILAFLRAAAG